MSSPIYTTGYTTGYGTYPSAIYSGYGYGKTKHNHHVHHSSGFASSSNR